MADAKAAVSAECAKELAAAKAVRAAALAVAVAWWGRESPAARGRLERAELAGLRVCTAVVVGLAHAGPSGLAVNAAAARADGAARHCRACVFCAPSARPLPTLHPSPALCLRVAQKVDAELAKALGQLEAEKAAAMQGMDAQVCAGSGVDGMNGGNALCLGGRKSTGWARGKRGCDLGAL